MKLKSMLAASLFSGLFSVSVQAENLIEIYRLALENDALFLSQGATLEANLENQNQSFAGLMPSLSGSYSRGYNKQGSSAGGVISPQTESQSDSLGLSLRQSIYDYSIWVGYDQAKKRAEQARVNYRANQQDLVVRVAQVYLNVLSAQDNLEFVLAEQEAIKQELEQTKQRYEVGLIAITDVHEAQARFDQSEADRITAQNRLDNANEALREVTGRYHSNLGTLKQDIPLASPEPARIDDWVSVAKESNLNIVAANMEYYIAKQDVKRRFGGHLPSIDLTASYSDSTTDPSSFPIDTESYGLSGGISVNVPLYQGGVVSSQVKQGEALSRKASFDLEAALRSTVRSTRSAYLGVEASIAAIRALKQSVISQESALEATQAGFEVGTRTIVDVLLSTRNLFSARSRLAQARYDYVIAILELKRAAGILTEDDLTMINQWIEQVTAS